MEPILVLKIVAIAIGLIIAIKFASFLIKLVIKIIIGAGILYLACLVFGINLLDYI